LALGEVTAKNDRDGQKNVSGEATAMHPKLTEKTKVNWFPEGIMHLVCHNLLTTC
jgi:hypothetical protein